MADQAPPCAGDGSCQARYLCMKSKFAVKDVEIARLREALERAHIEADCQCGDIRPEVSARCFYKAALAPERGAGGGE